MTSGVVVDEQTGVEFHPWTDGHAVGFRVVHPDGHVEYVYLNPSTDGGGDPAHRSNVFLYQGATGDTAVDTPWHHYNVEHQSAPASGTCKHCGRSIVLEEGRWVDPDATGDDSTWRETCDAHDTFTAEHEPAGPQPADLDDGRPCELTYKIVVNVHPEDGEPDGDLPADAPVEFYKLPGDVADTLKDLGNDYLRDVNGVEPDSIRFLA